VTVPVEEIPELAATGTTRLPMIMPVVTSFFLPRKAGDRRRWCQQVE
jgi:oleate hydratase